MPERHIILMLVGAFVIATTIVTLIVRHLLREKYSMVWFLFSLGVICLAIFYKQVVKLTPVLGFVDSTTFLLLIIIGFLIMMNLQICVSLSSAFYQRKTLVQNLALLEERVRELEATGGGGPGGERTLT
jgi:hypothetical protein